MWISIYKTTHKGELETEEDRKRYQLYLHVVEGTKGSWQDHRMQVMCQSAYAERNTIY